MQAGISIRAIAYEKSGRWFTTEEPFLRAKERTDAASSAFRHPRSELIAPLPQEVEPAFNNRKLHMRLPCRGALRGLSRVRGAPGAAPPGVSLHAQACKLAEHGRNRRSPHPVPGPPHRRARASRGRDRRLAA